MTYSRDWIIIRVNLNFLILFEIEYLRNEMLDNTILQIEVEKIFTIQLKNKISPIIYYSKYR